MPDDLGPVVTGVFDVMLALTLALERKGYLVREEIAAVLTTVKEQIEAQEGGPTMRTRLAEWLLPVFKAPVAGEQARARLTVINGGGNG